MITLDNMTLADLDNAKITHHVAGRSYGRRFSINSEEVVFHTLYLKAKKLTKAAIKSQNFADLQKVRAFTATLREAEIEADKEYQNQDCIYKICTAFLRFFGDTPWFTTHLKQIKALEKKINKHFATNPLSDAWLACLENQPRAAVKVDILNSSQDFQNKVIKMSTGPNHTAKLIEKDPSIQTEIEANAKNVHTLIESSVHRLFSHFLEGKREYGSDAEKLLYKDMNVEEFVERLLTKRPLSSSSNGYALLRDGTFVKADFDTLALSDYLSSEEIQLSAFLVTATPTHFINRGEPDNIGIQIASHHYQRHGIYYGISGARLVNQDYLEDELVYIRPGRIPQNAPLWSSFFNGFTSFSYADADYAKDPVSSNFYSVADDCYLDKAAYKKLMEVRISAFLKDADNQAKALGKQAFLHLVPLGLENSLHGSNLPNPLRTTLSEIQQEIYQEQIGSFTNIATLHFNKFPGLNSKFRNPADKLDDDNLLLCVQYEANPYSYPGNWYWHTRLGEGSGPALCSTIGELQNPLINENITNLYIYK